MSTSQKECLPSEHLGNSPYAHDACQQRNRPWVEGRGQQTASNLDHTAPCQGCVPPGCEVHLPNYPLSLQMRKGKVEVHTSVQVHMREIAGLEQFPVLTCIYKWTLVNLLAIFLLNVLFKELVQAITYAFT